MAGANKTPAASTAAALRFILFFIGSASPDFSHAFLSARFFCL